MKQHKAPRQTKSQEGYAILVVLILIAVGAVVTLTALTTASSMGRTNLATKKRGSDYYNAELSLNSAITWLRSNSTSLAMSFSRTNFYSTFDRVTPSYGSNDTGRLKIPTKLRLQNTNSTALLASPTLMSSSYPTSIDTNTGNTFNAATSFASAVLGSDLVRITLIDATAVDSTKDYGDPDSGAAQPLTDFNPVFRIDAIESTSKGTHLAAYFSGSLQYDYGVGFYGKNYLEIRQSCDSYLSNNGPYNLTTNHRANCPAGSHGTISIHQQEQIYGSARTKGAFDESSPYGGPVCADFASGCPNKGTKCSGATCQVPSLPVYSPWNVYCPSNQGNLNVNNNATLSVAGNNANQKCWGTVSLGNNKNLTLTSTNYAYYIDTLDIPNNGQLRFAPNPATGTINLYVRSISGNTLNGNQAYNLNNKPYQLRIHYLGTNNLTLNGTADMNAFLIAPYANVTIQGNFVYQGGIKALGVTLTGSGKLHYDESGDITTISDITFKTRNIMEVYE